MPLNHSSYQNLNLPCLDFSEFAHQNSLNLANMMTSALVAVIFLSFWGTQAWHWMTDEILAITFQVNNDPFFSHCDDFMFHRHLFSFVDLQVQIVCHPDWLCKKSVGLHLCPCLTVFVEQVPQVFNFFAVCTSSQTLVNILWLLIWLYLLLLCLIKFSGTCNSVFVYIITSHLHFFSSYLLVRT